MRREFSFSNISFKDLKYLGAKKIRENKVFESWFNTNIEISKIDLEFLQKINLKYGENKTDFFRQSSEDTIKVKFISPILEQICFYNDKQNISDFYHEKLYYLGNKFILNGFCDFYVARGEFTPEEPYFFIQEFKKSNGSDPEPQLLAEMIAGLEISNFSRIKGAFIIGSIWNFVILDKIDKDSYNYYISENFDSTKMKDLEKIYKNLLYVKQEILNNSDNILKQQGL
ncbi:MAG: hypothetical protein U9Q30_02790 [Campylobacterota bacterium]|nr:hypothetical protein [Campylobacterota bacterium]